MSGAFKKWQANFSDAAWEDVDPETAFEAGRAEGAAKERAALVEELETECDVSADRAWVNQFHCGTHGCWFRSSEEFPVCPVGSFAMFAQNAIRVRGEAPKCITAIYDRDCQVQGCPLHDPPES